MKSLRVTYYVLTLYQCDARLLNGVLTCLMWSNILTNANCYV